MCLFPLETSRYGFFSRGGRNFCRDFRGWGAGRTDDTDFEEPSPPTRPNRFHKLATLHIIDRSGETSRRDQGELWRRKQDHMACKKNDLGTAPVCCSICIEVEIFGRRSGCPFGVPIWFDLTSARKTPQSQCIGNSQQTFYSNRTQHSATSFEIPSSQQPYASRRNNDIVGATHDNQKIEHAVLISKEKMRTTRAKLFYG